MVEKKWHRFAFDASALPRARLSRASAYFVDGLSIFIFFLLIIIIFDGFSDYYFRPQVTFMIHRTCSLSVMRRVILNLLRIPSQDTLWQYFIEPKAKCAQQDDLVVWCRDKIVTMRTILVRSPLCVHLILRHECLIISCLVRIAPLCCISDLDEPMRGDPTSRVLSHQLPGQNCLKSQCLMSLGSSKMA